MKKNKLLIIIFVMILMIPTLVSASNKGYVKIGDNVTVKRDVIHNFFAIGNSVTTRSNVDGISFVIGNNLKINDNSEYEFIVGNSININSNIEKDLFILGNSINITSSQVERDIYILGSSVDISSNIEGNAFIMASSLVLDNMTIKGDLLLNSSTIMFGDNVTIEGNIKYNESSVVSGIENVKYKSVEKYKIESENKEYSILNNLYSKFKSMLSLLLVGIILLLICPSLFDKINLKYSLKSIMKNLLIGLFILVVVPIICILLLTTVIGLPLSLIILAIYFICIYISQILTSYFIGNILLTKVFKAKDNRFISLLIGVLLIKLISLIPVIGAFISLVVLLIGLGLILNCIKKTQY
ncbi:MAG: hypothetical protein Q4E75_05990 [bacterium]|nr:hypothetical protein [bacterium]